MNQTPEHKTRARYLAVDLDGTLVHTDLLVESIFALLKVNFFYLFLLPLWVLRGKAQFKAEIARRADVNISLLPYNEPLVAYLREQKAQGRELILATAAQAKYARAIADHLDLFDTVFCTSGTENLRGQTKRRALIEHCGEGQFDYAGNEPVDLDIWSHSKQAIVVSNDSGFIAKARQTCEIDQIFAARGGGIKPYVKQLRLHQWLKNLLIFVPLLTGHHLLDETAIVNSLLAFIAFGLCASSVYVLNDALDLESDREHAKKRFRPLAHGDIPIGHALLLIPLTMGLGFLIAAQINPLFVLVLALYYMLTLLYSVRLKSMVLLDVIALASLYTTRIIAGGAATAIDLSFWLLAFSMFMFFSLALIKRVSELLELAKRGTGKWVPGRGYQVDDLGTLQTLGISAGYVAVFVVAMYINSPEISALYTYPKIIWLICPILLYWISRVWIMVSRGQMHSDPLIFAATDRVSYYALLLCGLILFAAT